MPREKGASLTKRKPTAIKVSEGTFRKDRAPIAEPEPSSDKPRPPHWLNDRAKVVFDELVLILDEMQLASASQVDMLTLLAQRMEEVERFSVYLDDVGTSYETTSKTGDTMWRAYPEVAQKNEAMRHAHSLLAEFGLSPSSVGAVSVLKDTGDNPWEELTK